MPSVHRVRVLVGVASAACIGLLVTVGHLAWVDLQHVRRPVPPQTAELLELVVALAALAVLAWLLLAVVASALAALPGRASVAARWVAARIAPGTLRRGVAAVVLSGAVASAAPGAALAEDGVPHGSATTSVALSPTGTGTGPQDVFAAPDPAPMPAPGPTTAPTAPVPVDGGPDSAQAPPRPGHEGTPIGLGPLRPPVRISSSDTVVVRPGDCLWSLAAQHLGPEATEVAIAAEWPRWYAANADVIGDNPDLLVPGLRLRTPGAR